MTSVSAVVLTRNEEHYLPECLAHLTWADEVLVLDSDSDDRTREVARKGGARVVVHTFTNYGAQRQAALAFARHDWVLFVDADERVPPALAEEIREVVDDERPEVGWWIPRRNFFWGNEVRHAGWSPDYQLRLLRRGHAWYDITQVVHEVAEIDGEAGYLSTPLIHLNYDSWREFFTKQATYAHYEAQRWHAEGKQVRLYTFLLQPLRAFWRRYVTWDGYRDGRIGLALSVAMAWFELLTCRHVWRLQRKASHRSRSLSS